MSSTEAQSLKNGAAKPHYGTALGDSAQGAGQEIHDDAVTSPMLMYISHFLSAFDDRVWQFAVPVLLMNVWKETLFPSAVISFVTNVLTFILMPYVGAWVDNHDRISIMSVSIIGESASIVVAAVLLCYVASIGLTNGGKYPIWDTREVVAFSMLCLANASTELTMRVGQQALEKDWAVVVSKALNQDPTILNTRMRRIDLGCKLLGPAVFGLFVQFVSGTTPMDKINNAAIALSVWNIFVMPIEFVTVHKVYHMIPKLQTKVLSQHDATSPLKVLYKGWKSYFSHEVFAPSIAYGFLWFTVLDNGVLMTAYLQWQGVPEAPLGFARGLGAIVGLVGTIIYPMMLVRAGGSVLRAGRWAIWLFWACLVPIGIVFVNVGSLWLSAMVMIGCVTISRAWLWAFDLTIQRILQDSVTENERGVINGVHTAVTQLMLVLSSLAGMMFADPSQFTYLVFISLMSVLLAAVLYDRWVRLEMKAETADRSKYHAV